MASGTASTAQGSRNTVCAAVKGVRPPLTDSAITTSTMICWEPTVTAPAQPRWTARRPSSPGKRNVGRSRMASRLIGMIRHRASTTTPRVVPTDRVSPPARLSPAKSVFAPSTAAYAR